MEVLRRFKLKLKQLPTKDSRLVEFRKVHTFVEAVGPRMKKEIKRFLDLFNPGCNETKDIDWNDLVKAIKQVANYKRWEEEEEDQNREMSMLIEEIQKLKTMVAR